jgi:hypothetical protein
MYLLNPPMSQHEIIQKRNLENNKMFFEKLSQIWLYIFL